MSYLATRMILCLLGALAIGLIVGWLLRRFSAIEREAELSGEIDLRGERLGALEGDLGERDQRIMALGEDLSDLQGRLPELESTLAQREDQVMSLTMDLDSWKEKVPWLESRLAESAGARDQLDLDLADKQKLLHTSEDKANELAAELETLRAELASNSEHSILQAQQLNSEISSRNQQLDSVRLELAAAATASSEAKTLRDKLQADYRELKAQSDAQTADGHEREKAFSELRTSLKSQDAERASLAQQLTSLAPVAARVDSQDASIVSLNNDLRARDTTIKSLRDELAVNLGQIKKLGAEVGAVTALRSEMDTLRTELTGARKQLESSHVASKDGDLAVAQTKEKAAGGDREWRSRLRIAESGRQQAHADLYRRQEQIERLEKQLSAARAESIEPKARPGVSGAANNSGLGLTGGAAATGAAGPAMAMAQSVASDNGAGRVKETDDRDWRAQLRVAESARRNAQAQALRETEQVKRLEVQLRALARQTVPGQDIALTKTLRTKMPVAKATSPKAPVAKVPGLSETSASSEQRFLTTKPQEVDDLREIKGVGKVLQKTLNSLGIYQYLQVANFTDDDIAWVDDRLKFKGRIERDKWIKQAAKLHRNKYGSNT